MEIPQPVLFLLENYESVIHNYNHLPLEIKDELEELYLIRDPKALVQQNELVRKEEVAWTESINSWPKNYFVIGHDGCGNYYYLETNDYSIGCYDHDEPSFQQEAPSLSLYANEISRFLIEDV